MKVTSGCEMQNGATRCTCTVEIQTGWNRMDARSKSETWKQNRFRVIVRCASNQSLHSWGYIRRGEINTSKHTKHNNSKIIVWGWVPEPLRKKNIYKTTMFVQLIGWISSSGVDLQVFLLFLLPSAGRLEVFLKEECGPFPDDCHGKIRLERRFRTQSWRSTRADVINLGEGEGGGGWGAALRNDLNMQRNTPRTKHTLCHLKAVLNFHVTF